MFLISTPYYFISYLKHKKRVVRNINSRQQNRDTNVSAVGIWFERAINIAEMLQSNMFGGFKATFIVKHDLRSSDWPRET